MKTEKPQELQLQAELESQWYNSSLSSKVSEPRELIA